VKNDGNIMRRFSETTSSRAPLSRLLDVLFHLASSFFCYKQSPRPPG
jgi:hypothetical protein